MHCSSCKVRMIESQHHERETLAGFVLITTVQTKECPACSALIKTILPAYVKALK